MSTKENIMENNNNNCIGPYILRSSPAWRYKVADNLKSSEPSGSSTTTLFKDGQLESLRILLKEPTMMNQIRVESSSEASSAKEEPLKQQMLPGNAETNRSFEPQEPTVSEEAESKHETIYNLESGNMLYVRFPLGIPPISEVMKLHPRITNVLLSVYDAARFCYLLFPSKDEAEDARKKLSKLESSGKIVVSMDKSLDNIIEERTSRLLPVLSRMRRRRNGVCRVFPGRRCSPRNLKQEKQQHEEQHRQRVQLLNVREHSLIHEIRFLNQSLMCLRKQKFLLKMRKSEVTHKLDKLWEKKMMIRAIQQ